MLHWPLSFPSVMAKGALMLLWESSLGAPQLNEVEFFASRDDRIANLSGDRRKKPLLI